MITILADHNIEGQAVLLLGTLVAEGWLELCPTELVLFADVGLPLESSDRVVWRLAQARGMILLTDNRSQRGEDSLEQTIREENTTTSLPVLTIGNVSRLVERAYREQCAARLVEIVLDMDNYVGTGRLFIP